MTRCFLFSFFIIFFWCKLLTLIIIIDSLTKVNLKNLSSNNPSYVFVTRFLVAKDEQEEKLTEG